MKHSADGKFRVQLTPRRDPNGQHYFDVLVADHNRGNGMYGKWTVSVWLADIEAASRGDFTAAALHPLTQRADWADLFQVAAGEAIARENASDVATTMSDP